MFLRVAIAQFGTALVFAVTFSSPAAAQVILHNFTDSPNDGKFPNGTLTQYGASFYGMTTSGGNYGDGTIFRMGTDGSNFTVIHNFLSGFGDGYEPDGSLLLAGSVFFGMAGSGGGGANGGTVFSFNPDGSGYKTIHAFSAGSPAALGPTGTPIVSGGVVYGMTSAGGTANKGTVFRMNNDGTGYQIIHSFTGGPGDGSLPSNSALVVSNGLIYGMTPGGGNNFGVIFRMNTDGSGFVILHSFNPLAGDGGAPAGSLTLVGDTLYGTSHRGGSTGLGTVFKIGTDGTNYTNLRSFSGSPSDGAQPVGTFVYDGTRLYGSTPQGGAYGVGSNNALGVLLGLDPDGSNYDVLYSFPGGLAGGGPGDVIEYNGALYGMAGAGGTANDGVIFSFPISVPEPSTFLLTGLAAVALAARLRRLRRRRAHANREASSHPRD
jgi:uncharacterized repeat protein (TIGR03803 family)